MSFKTKKRKKENKPVYIIAHNQEWALIWRFGFLIKDQSAEAQTRKTSQDVAESSDTTAGWMYLIPDVTESFRASRKTALFHCLLLTYLGLLTFDNFPEKLWHDSLFLNTWLYKQMLGKKRLPEDISEDRRKVLSFQRHFRPPFK